jgi:hypothetical protein
MDRRRRALLLLGLGAAAAVASAGGCGARVRAERGTRGSRQLAGVLRRDYVGAATAFDTTRKARWVASRCQPTRSPACA